jgi:hypothetical protein
MFWNTVTGSVIGLVVAGIAFGVTGRNHVADRPADPVADTVRDDSE